MMERRDFVGICLFYLHFPVFHSFLLYLKKNSDWASFVIAEDIGFAVFVDLGETHDLFSNWRVFVS